MRCLVLNDAPTIDGDLVGAGPTSVTLDGDMRISITGPGVVPETWKLTYTLQRLTGQAPTFNVSLTPMRSYDPNEPQ